MVATRDEADAPWKEILDGYFPSFLELCFPEVAKEVDWSRGHEFLDKELLAIVKEAEIGHRQVDKLIKVWRLGGDEIWVLLHLEIQGQFDNQFDERMFVYHYRLFDRYQKPVVSMAMLIDGSKRWRPQHYEKELCGCKMRFDFLMVKVLDFERQREQLLVSDNPFAIVILAQLDALKSKGDPQSRYQMKFALTRNLYLRGWDRQKVFDLFRFLDWLLVLPESLEINYTNQVGNFVKENDMATTYMAPIEKIWLERGVEQGIEQGEKILLLRLLQNKFGPLPGHYEQLIKNADAQTLEVVTENLLDAKSLANVFEPVISNH